MGVMEIVLLIAGGLIFILSFVIPVKREKDMKDTRELAREEIKSLVEEELGQVKAHVNDVVDEAVGSAMEKTERSLERLSNEKIMAVNEYSDTVLHAIHKNHEEVMFLYDMLNDKHKNLKSTVSEVTKTVKEVEETAREAEAVVQEVKKEAEAVAERQGGFRQEELPAQPENAQPLPLKPGGMDGSAEWGTDKVAGEAGGMDISFIDNSNQRILEMYSQGRSKVAIARELGLGVGEVKLVIDLYKGMQQNTGK